MPPSANAGHNARTRGSGSVAQGAVGMGAGFAVAVPAVVGSIAWAHHAGTAHQSTPWLPILLINAAALGLFAFACSHPVRVVTRRLNRLSSQLAAVASGDLSVRLARGETDPV